MNKVWTVLLVAALIAMAAPAPGAERKKQQVVEGTILLPAPLAQGRVPFDGCWNGLHRRVVTLAKEAGRGGTGEGVVGYAFEVDKTTWGKPFKLDVTGGQGNVDLDIALYQRMAELGDWWGDPVNAGCGGYGCKTVNYGARGEGGEAGIVPPDTLIAFVCMYGGPSHAGAAASFRYVAGQGVPKPKGPPPA